MKAQTETREFQTEIRQLLDIVINSLYTDKEIFLRELISNAADASGKLRYLQLTGEEISCPDLGLEIKIEVDENANTLTISDSGVGMTKDELIENLGTIAHSGSKQFIQHLLENRKANKSSNEGSDLNLIGQFGVGFYAAFMVANKVTLKTKSYKPDQPSWSWSSDGSGTYVLEEIETRDRGTSITLELKEDAKEFGKIENIKRIIKQYSSFVPYPILVGEEKVNTVEALWIKNKKEISTEEYTEFYKFVANAYDDPIYTLHFSSDAPLALHALLFVPGENFERYGISRMERGVNLFCKKVLIQEKSENIAPEWMRFVRGVIDSEELPLNISREMLQDSALIAKLNKVVTSRFLKFLDEQAKEDPAKYKDFWAKFGMFIKEGAATDFTHQDGLVKLLRFESNRQGAGEIVSLADYVSRMKEDQKGIYYVSGPNRETIEGSPYLESFKGRDIEVLYCYDPVDDYIFDKVNEFEGKSIFSAEQDNLDLPTVEDDSQDVAAETLSEEEIIILTEWLKQTLGSKVTEVRVSKRLTDSPAMVLSSYSTHSMQRIMQMMNKDASSPMPGILEINTKHKIIQGLNELRKKDDNFASVAAEQILETAQIAAGLIIDPRSMVNRLYSILERAVN